MIDTPLTVIVRDEVLLVSGAVSELGVAVFDRQLDDFVRSRLCRGMVIDLRDVEFLPGSVLGKVVRSVRYARAYGGTVEVRTAAGSHVARVMALAGLPYIEEAAA
jgi:anti-anti-sigma regulatory factor